MKFIVKKNKHTYEVSDENKKFKFIGDDLMTLFQKATQKSVELKKAQSKNSSINFFIKIYQEHFKNLINNIIVIFSKLILQIFFFIIIIYFTLFTIFQNIDDYFSYLHKYIEHQKLEGMSKLSDKEIKFLEIYKFLKFKIDKYENHLND